MTKYTEADFMPPGGEENPHTESDGVTPEEIDDSAIEKAADEETLDSEGGEEDTVQAESEVQAESDPEQGVVSYREPTNRWASIALMFFSPLLMSTYAVVIAMWMTALSGINENTRLGVTFVVFLVTALIPLSYKLTVGRILLSGERKIHVRNISTACVVALCQFFSAYYLYRIYAPEWLTMILVAGGVIAVVFAVVNIFTAASMEMTGMGALTGVVFFLGRKAILESAVTPWAIMLILLSGFAASACVAARHTSLGRLSISYAASLAITYIIMSIHFFDPLQVPVN